MVKALKVLSSQDPYYWYKGLIGKYVPLVREETDVYISREQGGYANIVRKEDVLEVEITDTQKFY